ncbi:MAG: hypothetical protein IPI67_32560 [Myxococcales bacterium]|nr:hypothetical protein [Myxococcales bacterium]
MSALLAGARLVRLRLWGLASFAGVCAALVCVALGALYERRTGSLVATDRALTGVALGLVLPLLAHGAVSRALGGAAFQAALTDLARHGANRRTSAAGVMSALAFALGLAGALIAALAVFVTRAPADPQLVRDLATSSWIGALAGAAYATWFCLGATFGKRGGGRGAFLVLDWIVGAGAGAGALFWPRGHVRNLLGAEPVLGMPEWSATLALSSLAVIYSLLTLWRLRR